MDPTGTYGSEFVRRDQPDDFTTLMSLVVWVGVSHKELTEDTQSETSSTISVTTRFKDGRISDVSPESLPSVSCFYGPGPCVDRSGIRHINTLLESLGFFINL